MSFPLPLWMQAEVGDPDLEYSGQYDRVAWDMIFQSEGVIGQSSLIVSQRAAGANFSVDVSIGDSAIQGDTTPDQGTYLSRSTTVVNVAIPGPPVSGTRTHRVVKQIRDNLFDAGGDYDWVIETIEDTTGSGTTEPDSAITLAYVEVTNGQTSVLDTHITDARPFASGVTSGVASVPTRTDLPGTGVLGQRIVIEDLAPISVEWDGSAWRLNGAAATLFVERTSDDSRTSNITMADDTQLAFTMLTEVIYDFEAVIGYTAGTTGDFRFQVVVPTDGSYNGIAYSLPSASTGASGSVSQDRMVESDPFIGGGTPTEVMEIFIKGKVWSGDGGTCKIQWAQAVSSGTATTIIDNSYMVARPVKI